MCQGENLGPSNTFVVGFFNIRNGLQEIYLILATYFRDRYRNWPWA